MFRNFGHLASSSARGEQRRALKESFKKGPNSHLPQKAETTSLVQTVSRGSVSASDTPVKGTLRRAQVPEGTSVDASLGVEGTPSDSVPHDYLLEENRRDITGSESAIERVSVSAPEVT